ncbi:MAG: glycosyl hydrolase [Dehalococcoidia bacterium]
MGVIPFHTNSPEIDCNQLKAGALDADIRRWGQYYATLKPKPVFVRYMHEMNLNFGTYPWAAFRCGGAAGYIQAFQRVHDILVQAGATNVLHVWCPNAYWGANDASNHLWFKQYYPGDAYVDWMCVDGYDWYGEYKPDGTKYLTRRPLRICSAPRLTSWRARRASQSFCCSVWLRTRAARRGSQTGLRRLHRPDPRLATDQGGDVHEREADLRRHHVQFPN